jgi:hypothetical protein
MQFKEHAEYGWQYDHLNLYCLYRMMALVTGPGAHGTVISSRHPFMEWMSSACRATHPAQIRAGLLLHITWSYAR